MFCKHFDVCCPAPYGHIYAISGGILAITGLTSRAFSVQDGFAVSTFLGTSHMVLVISRSSEFSIPGVILPIQDLWGDPCTENVAY